MRAATFTMLGVAVALLLTCTVVVSAPGVQIAAPEAGARAQVGETLQVLVIVSPELEVSSVVAMCDAKGIGMAQAPPYAFQWNTAGLEPGDHVLRATVYLKSGEKVGAEPVTVFLFKPRAPTAGLAPTATPAATIVAPAALKEGTPVLLQTTEKMVSGRVAEGSTVRYRVARDIVGPGDNVLIAYGSFAQGRVTRSRRRGMFGKAGQLEFTVDTVDAVDGTVVPLRAQQEVAGKGNKNEVIISALLLSVLAVFVHGRDVEIPADTEVTAYVDHDTVIQRPQPAAEGGAVRSAPVSVRPAAAGEATDADERAGTDLVGWVARGELAAEAFVANSGLPGSIIVVVTNRTGSPVSADVTPGTVFTPVSEQYARLVARKVTAARVARSGSAQADSVYLEAHETKGFYMEAYALDMGRKLPPADASLRLGRVHSTAGWAIAMATGKGLAPRAVQAAIWMKADGASIETVSSQLSLTHEEIALLQQLGPAPGPGSQ